MTSQLNVDTIVDKAGSGGTNIKVGNTATYVADGGSATQNLVQGLAKAWSKLNGTGTISLYDSFNISSVTDNGTGDYTHTMTSAMSNANYSHVFTARTYFAVFKDGQTPTTTTYRISHIFNNGSDGAFGSSDGNYISANITGDLA